MTRTAIKFIVDQDWKVADTERHEGGVREIPLKQKMINATALLLLCAALAATAGCDGSGSGNVEPGMPVPTSPPHSQPASSSTSLSPPTSTSPADVAGQQATDLVRRYFELTDDLGLDRSADANRLYDVSIDPQASVAVKDILSLRTSDWVQSGREVVVSVKVEDVQLTDAPAASAPTYPTVHLMACVDLRPVQVVDSAGNSHVAPDRPNALVNEMTVVNIYYPNSAGWRVSDVSNSGVSSCAG